MKQLTLAAVTALALVFAAPALAHPGKSKGERFARMDTNGDGILTTAEVEAAARTSFTAIDANGDGFVTPDELKAHHEAMRAEAKAKWDETKATREDGPAKAEADPARAQAWKAKRAERAQTREAKKAEMFASADTDGDGRWSVAEFTAPHVARFARLDTDGDGRVTADERAAARAKMKEQRGKWQDKPASQ